MDEITRHHNAPPLADQIALAYSAEQLAEDHKALFDGARDLIAQATTLTVVDTAEENAAASALVIALREKASLIDRTHDEVKKPVWDAGKMVDAVFNGFSALTGHKRRIEGLIAGRSQRIAAEERRRAQEAAAAERERAAKAEEAARLQEEANRPQVAEVLLDQGVKAEQIADRLDERAQGPVQDLARERTPVATTGLRAVKEFEIEDLSALTISLGPLGTFFTADAIMAALRKYRSESEKFVGEWAFRDDDQDSLKRYVIPRPHAIPGVAFFVRYAGMVRA